ncbi:polysaccharide pyruvyl transferase family protein [Bacillus sp. KH172YL63]|uniref:polysaccharide pyruvyl transferase family protein n=1 Tax=Bacillus sp. KH172YL63 TaxID=2709784 RepID=UPI0013E414D5|nr:polysaccharide pyruvyl transferase family protein [Bacillus sp. KH172YL63]BCB05866.1 hypothetical protein KH172YL63_39990 [Bacillus sp. KH172YL63]
MKVLIVGWFGEKNIGDELILESTYEQVMKRINPDKIYIASNQKVSKKYNWIYDHEFTMKSWAKLILRANIWENIRAYKEVDIILYSVGGGVSDWNKVVIRRLINRMKFFKLLGKKQYFIGVGAGPFVGNVKKEKIKDVFSLADSILVRDKTSKDNLDKLGLNNIILSNDIVFENENLREFYEKNKMVTKKDQVSIIPTPLFYNSLWNNNEQRLEEYINSMREIIKFLSEKYDVLIIPFQKEFDKQYFINHLTDCEFSVLDYNKYEEVYTEIIKSKFVVPMRFHGMVLSTLFETPMIPIIYDHKLSDLSKMLEIENISLSVGDGNNWLDTCFSKEEFIQSFNELLNNEETIKKNIQKYKENADVNGKIMEGV